jgi:nucleotide-binding universal stress UspA family protein
MPAAAHELRVLFPVSFSAACRRASRTLTQLTNGCRLDLTLLHAVRAGQSRRARHELEMFPIDRSLNTTCRRVLLEVDDAPQAIGEVCRTGRFDLVVAPAGERRGIQHLLARSFRARLLRQCSVPLWTAGPAALAASPNRPIRTVACLMDFDNDRGGFVKLVQSFAARFNARVHFLYVVPPVDEGMLADSLASKAPLMPAVAVKRIRELFPPHQPPEIDVAVGERGRELRRMLARCDADLLFVGPRQATATAWGLRFSRDLDQLPCPVVCVDGAAAGFPRWSFQDRMPEPISAALGDRAQVLAPRATRASVAEALPFRK